jgi:hypothetical protein
MGLDRFLLICPSGKFVRVFPVILKCERGKPRRMGHGLSSFEAREEARTSG